MPVNQLRSSSNKRPPMPRPPARTPYPERPRMSSMFLRVPGVQRTAFLPPHVVQPGIQSRGAASLVQMIGILMLLSGIVSAADTPVRTVTNVDLERYLGVWHEVARLPNRFEDHCVSDVTATYKRRPDGRLDVTNRCRTKDGGPDEANGVARVVDTSTNAKLKVRFAPAWLGVLPFVWGDYWIIGLADDYSYAIVGSPDRKYLWFLSRSPELDRASWDAALAIARDNGFDLSRLIRVPSS